MIWLYIIVCMIVEFFTGNYVLWHPPHFVIIFDPQAITLTLTLISWPWLFEPKISRRWHIVEDCCHAIPIRSFHFTHHKSDKVIAISTPPYCVAGADNDSQICIAPYIRKFGSQVTSENLKFAWFLCELYQKSWSDCTGFWSGC